MKLKALEDIVAKIEGRIDPEVEDFVTVFPPKSTNERKVFQNAYDAYNGSLDAAKALHEAGLPEWTRFADATAPEMGITITLLDTSVNEVVADLPCEARAWLLAILRALVEQLE